MAQQRKMGRRTAVRAAGTALVTGAALATGMAARKASAGGTTASLVGN